LRLAQARNSAFRRAGLCIFSSQSSQIETEAIFAAFKCVKVLSRTDDFVSSQHSQTMIITSSACLRRGRASLLFLALGSAPLHLRGALLGAECVPVAAARIAHLCLFLSLSFMRPRFLTANAPLFFEKTFSLACARRFHSMLTARGGRAGRMEAAAKRLGFDVRQELAGAP
jgi:hypothetical protein